MATRKYNKTKLDLQYNKKNDNLEFYVSDTDTSDFYIKLTRANIPINLDEVIVVLCVVDPKHQFRSQFINANTDKEGMVYCNLDKSMKSVVGDHQAKIMLIYEDEKIVTDNFTYTIKNDSFVALNREVVADDRFTVLTEMLSEISKIKNREDGRIVAESERVATIERIKNEIAQLTLDINTKVNTNISENTNKTNELVSSVNITVNNSLNSNTSKVDDLVTRGNTSLSEIETSATNLIASVEEYKTNAVSSIDTYKVTKDSEINQLLTNYKVSTTKSINSFAESEMLQIRNDLVLDTDTYKAILDSQFSNSETTLQLNVNNFTLTKSNYIDSYLQNKTLELTNFISSKDTELDNYVLAKTSELNTYKTTKNAEIDKYISDKNTEFNNSEKTRSTNESRRETNEYSRGLNENKRNTDFNTMKTQFAQMVRFNSNGELEVTIDGVTKVFTPKSN